MMASQSDDTIAGDMAGVACEDRSLKRLDLEPGTIELMDCACLRGLF